VVYAHGLGLVPITTPLYSPQSTGLAEAFVKTFNYVQGAELLDAKTVLAQLGAGLTTTIRAPHSALGIRSRVDYRAEELTLSSSQ
jgi:putative transposase